MPPSHLSMSAPVPTGRYLSLAEREQIALLRARDVGMREIARQLGRAASTISRELRRNAATRSGGFEYHVCTAPRFTFGRTARLLRRNPEVLTVPNQEIPIQPVENPILCSPYKVPDQHWLYDTKTGIPSKVPGRRPASYWFKTERTGTAQQQMFAEERREDLPVAIALREDVKRWRESNWESASETTKKLLRHWWREDRSRRLFFCQIEAVETIIYLREILARGKKLAGI